MAEPYPQIDWRFKISDRGTHSGNYLDKLNDLVTGYNTMTEGVNEGIEAHGSSVEILAEVNYLYELTRDIATGDITNQPFTINVPWTFNGLNLAPGAGVKSGINDGFIIRLHENKNVTLSAPGGSLYLGYYETEKVILSASITTNDNAHVIATPQGELYDKGKRVFSPNNFPTQLDSKRKLTLAGGVTGVLDWNFAGDITFNVDVDHTQHVHDKLGVDTENKHTLVSHSGQTWSRNKEGGWVFQSGAGGNDSWTYSFNLFLSPDARTSSPHLAEIGQRASNEALGVYRGVRVVKYYGGTVVDGDFQAGATKLTGDLSGTNAIFSDYVLAGGGKVRLTTRSGTGVMRLSNGSNWGLLASGDTNSPRIGAFYGGQLVVQGYADADGALDSTKMLVTFNFQYDKTEFHKAVDFYGDINVQSGQKITCNSDSTHDKIRYWNSEYYTSGMKASQTYGWLNNYAISWTVYGAAARGFLWRNHTHGDDAGLMSLSTDGHLCVAGVIGLGGTTARYFFRSTDQFGWKNAYGNVTIGPQNGSYCHFITDRPSFYFDKKMVLGANVLSSYNADFYLQRAGTTMLTLSSSSATFAKHLNVPTIEVTSSSARHMKTIERVIDDPESIRYVVEGIGNKGVHIGQWTEEARQEKGLNERTHSWIMADTVAEFAEHLTTKDEQGRYVTANYLELIPYLLSSQAHEYKRADKLEEVVSKQDELIEKLTQRIEALEAA